MKIIVPLAFSALAGASTNANAWFFFFFPLPGARSSGDTCVTESAKPGDTFRSANGNVATVKSLSGTSYRCKQPDKPILAVVEYSMSASFAPKAGMKLPDGYSQQSLTEVQKFNGTLLVAKDNLKDSGVIVTSTKREVIPDISAYVARLQTSQANNLDDAQKSETEELTINGLRAWRFENKGKLKNLFGSRYTYLVTVLEGEQEVVAITAWTSTGNYDTQKEELKQLAENVTGLTPGPPADTGAGAAPAPGQPVSMDDLKDLLPKAGQ